MRRALFRALLSLHPSGFRERFEEEMLSVFDEAGSAAGFCRSALGSLFRQWTKDARPWCILGAVAGGLLTLGWTATLAALCPSPRPLPLDSRVDTLLTACLGALLVIPFTVILSTVTFRRLRRRV